MRTYNLVMLLNGIIGDDAKWGKTQNGKEFFTFTFVVNHYDKELADSTEREHSRTFIRVFCYDKRQLDYLHSVNVRRGQRVSVVGRISSCKGELRGITFMQNNVICRDITIIKTKGENDVAKKQ